MGQACYWLLAIVQDSKEESGFGWAVFEKGFGQDYRMDMERTEREQEDN
jgi:hypothetical protein